MVAEPPTREWGLILNGGRNVIRQAWWITTFRGLAIVVAILTINLVGDGLRDVVDPHIIQVSEAKWLSCQISEV